MQSLIESIKNGNAKDRLAIAADIVTILGISLATVVGGSLAFTGKLNISNIIGMSAMGILSLSMASIVVLAFILLSNFIGRRYSENSTMRIFLHFSVWSGFIALFLMAVLFCYEILSSVRFIN